MLEVLLPGRCAGCGRGAWPFCERCAVALPVITPPWCDTCGRPTDDPADRCDDCPPRSIAAARAPFLYAGPTIRAIRALKFTGWHALAPVFAGAMAEVVREVVAPRAVVTWVPLAPRRAARRGFDQAELLARALAEKLSLEVAPLLRRVRETAPQAKREAEARRRALQGAFEARPAPPSVLLVDDVLTTGATADASARALLRMGASRIVLATAARSIGGAIPARCR